MADDRPDWEDVKEALLQSIPYIAAIAFWVTLVLILVEMVK